jgi:hypothetical protein
VIKVSVVDDFSFFGLELILRNIQKKIKIGKYGGIQISHRSFVLEFA